MADPATTSLHIKIPSAKAQHKQKLFDAISHVISVALTYHASWTHEPSDFGILHFIADILLSLPQEETSIPASVLMMYNKLMLRSRNTPIRIVENVDPTAPYPEPALLRSADGTSTPIEQRPSSGLSIKANAPFQFSGNTKDFLPVKKPFTVTFVPEISQSPDALLVPPMSFVVTASGKTKIHKLPFSAAEDTHIAPTSTCSTTDKGPFREASLPHSEDSINSKTVTKVRESKADKSPDTIVPPSSFSSLTAAGQPPVSIPPPTLARPITPSSPITTASTDSIPSSFYPVSESNLTPPRTVPRQYPSSYNSTDNSNSVPPTHPEPCASFNHFPPHPHVNDGRPTVGRRIGLQRSYAFMHDSHPEIFWDTSFGERPKEAQAQTVADRSLPTSEKINDLNENTFASSSGSASVPDASTSPLPRSIVPPLRKERNGKKRARKVMGADEGDESRPPRRLRSGSAKETRSHRTAEATSERRSQRFTGMKNAVLAFTGSLAK